MAICLGRGLDPNLRSQIIMKNGEWVDFWNWGQCVWDMSMLTKDLQSKKTILGRLSFLKARMWELVFDFESIVIELFEGCYPIEGESSLVSCDQANKTGLQEFTM